jgi:dTDP-L-rhamnose 4-epimerase
MLILITGGAGFIGSHLADELLRHGHQVRALDVLSPQVHGSVTRPVYLHSDVELITGDVRDRDAVRRALDGVDAVYHFAAAVGVGQSMYEVAEYTSVNNLGTAVLLEALMVRPVRKLVVASSMSIYGEGLYRTAGGEIVEATERALQQLRAGVWEPQDDQGQSLAPVPTPEEKTPILTSVYALSKFDQERLCLMIGRAYTIPTVALRFFNVFGPRQALSNPYTGVLAIFASRLLNGNRPLIFEDGLQQRDFVSVYDVARARPHRSSGRRAARARAWHNDRAGDLRQVPRWRHSPLCGRHHPGAACARLHTVGEPRGRHRRTGPVAPAPGCARPCRRSER